MFTSKLELVRAVQRIVQEVEEKFPEYRQSLSSISSISVNTRMYRLNARVRWKREGPLIEFSWKVYSEPANVHTFRNTALHELAHVIAGPGKGHGPIWKAIAIRIGCDGKRCCENLGKPIPRRRNARVVLMCQCGRNVSVTTNKLTRARKRGSYLIHRECGNRLTRPLDQVS